MHLAAMKHEAFKVEINHFAEYDTSCISYCEVVRAPCDAAYRYICKAVCFRQHQRDMPLCLHFEADT